MIDEVLIISKKNISFLYSIVFNGLGSNLVQEVILRLTLISSRRSKF